MQAARSPKAVIPEVVIGNMGFKEISPIEELGDDGVEKPKITVSLSFPK
jgi:hypothetical protein